MLVARLAACALALAPCACVAYDHARYASLRDATLATDARARPDAVDVATDAPAASDAADAGPDAPADAADARDAADAAVEASVPACPARVVADYCAQVPALDVPPVIDGVLDCGLTLERIVPAHLWSHPTPPPSSLAITFATAWRADGLYAFVHVVTPQRTSIVPTYCADAVELFFDSDGMFASPGLYDQPGTRQFIIGAPPTGVDRSINAQVYAQSTLGEWLSPNYVAVGTPDGYSVEAFVTAEDLGLTSLALAAGGHVAFDVQVDFGPTSPSDAGGCALRLGQSALAVGTPSSGCTDGRASCNSGAFCPTVLLAR